MYGEYWFTGTFYFKHGGSQNATLKHVVSIRVIYLEFTLNPLLLRSRGVDEEGSQSV